MWGHDVLICIWWRPRPAVARGPRQRRFIPLPRGRGAAGGSPPYLHVVGAGNPMAALGLAQSGARRGDERGLCARRRRIRGSTLVPLVLGALQIQHQLVRAAARETGGGQQRPGAVRGGAAAHKRGRGRTRGDGGGGATSSSLTTAPRGMSCGDMRRQPAWRATRTTLCQPTASIWQPLGLTLGRRGPVGGAAVDPRGSRGGERRWSTIRGKVWGDPRATKITTWGWGFSSAFPHPPPMRCPEKRRDQAQADAGPPTPRPGRGPRAVQ